MADSTQPTAEPKEFSLGPLGTINQVIKALGRTIRAMAADEIDSQKGARICNGLGILRQCLETQKLEDLGDRLDRLEGIDHGANRTADRQAAYRH